MKSSVRQILQYPYKQQQEHVKSCLSNWTAVTQNLSYNYGGVLSALSQISPRRVHFTQVKNNRHQNTRYYTNSSSNIAPFQDTHTHTVTWRRLETVGRISRSNLTVGSKQIQQKQKRLKSSSNQRRTARSQKAKYKCWRDVERPLSTVRLHRSNGIMADYFAVVSEKLCNIIKCSPHLGRAWFLICTKWHNIRSEHIKYSKERLFIIDTQPAKLINKRCFLLLNILCVWILF